MPGDTDSASRFARAARYLTTLPGGIWTPDEDRKPQDRRAAIAGVLSVMRNVSQPFRSAGDPTLPNESTTLWRTIADLKERLFFFESTTNPVIVWLNAGTLDKMGYFDNKQPERRIDLVKNRELIGDLSESEFLEEAPGPFPFQPS